MTVHAGHASERISGESSRKVEAWQAMWLEVAS